MREPVLEINRRYTVRYWDEWEARVLIYIGIHKGFYIFICPDTQIQFKVRPSSAEIQSAPCESCDCLPCDCNDH